MVKAMMPERSSCCAGARKVRPGTVLSPAECQYPLRSNNSNLEGSKGDGAAEESYHTLSSSRAVEVAPS